MISISEAAKILQVSETTLAPFSECDPYNDNIPVEGFLCSQSDHRYGCLLITKVKGFEVEPEIVYCTPKLKYPFERQEDPTLKRKYHFPKFSSVRVYDKLDGTNICHYAFKDANGTKFQTFKTRLTPFLKATRFGDFKSLWDEVLANNSKIRDVDVSDFSLSYELFGYRNSHLIKYDVPLETRLLFSISRKDASIGVPDSSLWNNVGIPVLNNRSILKSTDDLVSFYEECRERAEKKNFVNEDGTISGTEGYVFYVLTTEGKWEQFKAKPESIETVHWSSGSIPRSVIIQTVWNALESSSDITIDYIKTLLAEEFSESQIGKSETKIHNSIEYVLSTFKFREHVKEQYNSCGLTFDKDGKATVMRALSSFFKKEEMKKVFSALKEMNLTK